MLFKKNTDKFPVEPQMVLRVLIAVIFVLALLAGYYFTKLKEAQKKYHRLEVRYEELIEVEE